jgi:hypothetical protein
MVATLPGKISTIQKVSGKQWRPKAARKKSGRLVGKYGKVIV